MVVCGCLCIFEVHWGIEILKLKSCLLCAGTLGGSGFAEQPVGCNETTAQPDFCETPLLDHGNFERWQC